MVALQNFDNKEVPCNIVQGKELWTVSTSVGSFRLKCAVSPVPKCERLSVRVKCFLGDDGFCDEFFKAWRSFRPMSVGLGSGFERPLPVLIGSDKSQPVIPWRVGLHQSPSPLHRMVSVWLMHTRSAQQQCRTQERPSLAGPAAPWH
jgi:hypothetical protein